MIIPPQFKISCFLVLPILKDVSALKSRHNDLFLSGMQKHQHNDRYDFLLHDMNKVRCTEFFHSGVKIADCEIKGF